MIKNSVQLIAPLCAGIFCLLAFASQTAKTKKARNIYMVAMILTLVAMGICFYLF